MSKNDPTQDGLPADLARLRVRVAELEREQAKHTATIQELALTKRHLDDAQRIAKLGNWYWDLKSGEILWSDGFYQVFGRDAASGPLTVEALMEFLHPDDRDRVSQAVDDAIAGRRPYRIDYRVRRTDNGEERWVHAEGEVPQDAEGNPLALVGTIQDITEQKLTMDALQASEERNRLLLEHAGLGIGYYDMDGNLLQLNRQAILNMGGLETNYVGRPVTEIFGREMGTRIMERLELTLEAGRPLVFEDCYPSPTEQSWFRSTYAIIQNAAGKPVGLQIISDDITERMKAEQALRENEEHLRILSGMVSDFIYVLDVGKDGKLEPRWSMGRVREMTGYAARTITPEFVASYFILAEDRPLFHDHLAKALAGELNRAEMRFVTRDGETRWMRSQLKPVCDLESGAVVRLFGAASDVTARHEMEDALRDREIKYRLLVENQNDLISKLDPDLRLTYASPSYCRTFDLVEEEILNQTFLDRVFAEDRPAVLVSLKRAMEPPYQSYHEDRSQTSEGQRWFGWSERAVLDADGRVTEIVSVGRDITARVKAENKLQEYADRLEEMVDERTKALKATQEQLVQSERLAVLGQLAGGVGHELRNPLGVIANAVYLLRQVLAEQEPDLEAIEEYLDIMNGEVRRAEQIVVDLLNFARARPVLRQQLSLPEVVNDVLVGHPTPAGIEIVTEIPADLPAVICDSNQLDIVLGNVIQNGLQAMPDGGSLTLRAAVSEDYVAVAVGDTGVGIPPEQQAKIFEPLFTTKARGIGLGLALSKRLIEANGGRIEFESQVGLGSEFVIYVPIAGKEAQERP